MTDRWQYIWYYLFLLLALLSDSHQIMGEVNNDWSIDYFKNLVETETNNFNQKCKEWNDVIVNHSELSEEVHGQIRSVVGQATLLIVQRFKQFLGLVKNCEYKLGEKETKFEDLQGFWDMIYFQVEDVLQKFKSLEELRSQNFQVKEKDITHVKKVHKITSSKNKATVPKSSMKSHILLARKRLKDAKSQKDKENKVFEVPGFFTVASPVKRVETSKLHANCTPTKQRCLSPMVQLCCDSPSKLD